jgi:hypothetical protein
MSKPEKSLRDELLAARSNVLRQIEILQAGPVIKARGQGPDFDPIFDPVLAELAATLKQIEDGLANLEDDDA